jgi:hypothetical protein
MKYLFAYFLISLCLSSLFISCKKGNTNQPPVANAGPSQTITLPTNSVTLTGSGTNADGSVVAYLWSEVSGPNTQVIGNSGTASTAVTGFIAGKYIFQLMITDNQGATGTDTVSVLVNPAIIDTLILQPSNNQTEVHIWGNGTSVEGSGIGSPEIGGADWTSGGSAEGMRAALEFDFSSIPASAIINSAKLTLYSNPTPLNGNQIDANYGTGNSFLIQQITAPWIGSSVRWNNQPTSTTVNQIIIPSTTQPFLDLPDIDVTALVSNMVKNNSNYGFFIRLQSEVVYRSRIFCSSKYSDASKIS